MDIHKRIQALTLLSAYLLVVTSHSFPVLCSIIQGNAITAYHVHHHNPDVHVHHENAFHGGILHFFKHLFENINHESADCEDHLLTEQAGLSKKWDDSAVHNEALRPIYSILEEKMHWHNPSKPPDSIGAIPSTFQINFSPLRAPPICI